MRKFLKRASRFRPRESPAKFHHCSAWVSGRSNGTRKLAYIGRSRSTCFRCHTWHICRSHFNISICSATRERESGEPYENQTEAGMQSWDGLRLGLLALGYQRVLWLHLHCVSHGVYRLGLAEEQEQYLCPVCSSPCKVSVMCEGYTKKLLRCAHELIDAT